MSGRLFGGWGCQYVAGDSSSVVPAGKMPVGERWGSTTEAVSTSPHLIEPSLERAGGCVQCVHLLIPHVTLFDGRTLDSVLVEPPLLTLRDTLIPEEGELNTGHWHFIFLLSQTLCFILKIQNGNPDTYWVRFTLPRVRWMFLSKFHTVSLKVQVSVICVELEYFWLR